MKKILILCLTLISLLFNTAWAADLSKLVIIHTNDTHGYDQRTKINCGMASVAALKKDYEAKGYTVLLLDAGDAIQDNNLVNFSKGKTAIEFMNASGYDAMTLGNHEFTYGQDVTLKRVKEAKFPVVSANIYVLATGDNFVKPSTIINKNGYKVGIFGLTTPETTTGTNPKNTIGLDFLAGPKLHAIAQQQINQLRKAGCQVVVALVHLGSNKEMLGDKSDDVLNDVHDLDICIDGHDHKVKNRYINNCLLVETGCHTEHIGIVTFDGKKWEGRLLAPADYTKEDAQVKNLIDKRAAEISKDMNKKIGWTDFALNGERFPGVRNQETNLGDLFTDAFVWQAKQALALQGRVDGAIINGGGIRASLTKGIITRGNIQSLAPFKNQLYVVGLTGRELLEILEAATFAVPGPAGTFPQVSGIEYTVDTRVPFSKGGQYGRSKYYIPANPGSRVTIKKVGGKPFALGKNYTLAVSEFLANGGDAYGALQTESTRSRMLIGYTDDQALENYIKEGLDGKVSKNYAQPQGRITILQ
jgi:5'-nucleotidase/UDP-sugar diphosphatase